MGLKGRANREVRVVKSVVKSKVENGKGYVCDVTARKRGGMGTFQC